ncbi:MAG: CDP-glucose 4,6-dehydratase [Bacteroidetes bacterium]|nr:CDP-glucose 4,6-dehydratase [Bacteroidota bacterium]
MFEEYKDRKVLITGATGFKGAWLTFILKRFGAEVHGFGLNPDTEPNLHGIFGHDKDEKIQIKNILESGYTDYIVDEIKPDILFHLASQPLVSESYKDPAGTFSTNITGLVNLLETLRRKSQTKNVVVITSDKCYSTEYGKKYFSEEDPMGGLDPYSASKACAEIVTKSYYNSFLKEVGINVVTARAGNIVGGGDWSKDRLIPDIVKAISGGRDIELRNPGAIRPWQHVFDALCGYLTIGEKMLGGKLRGFKSYNFGPAKNEDFNVLRIAAKFAEKFGISGKRIVINNPDFYETEILKLDTGRVYRDYGWKSVWNTEECLEASAEWYMKFYYVGTKITEFSEMQFENYLSKLSDRAK